MHHKKARRGERSRGTERGRLATLPLLSTWGLLLLGACRTAPEPAPFSGPSVELHVRTFDGTPLGGGARRESSSPLPTTLDAVTAQVFALESFPDDVLTPASSAARLVVSLSEDEPLLSTGRWTRDALFASSEADVDAFEDEVEDGSQGRVATVGRLRGALARGTTVGFRVEGTRRRPIPGRPEGVRERVEVFVHRDGGGGLESGLLLEGARQGDHDPDPALRREAALFSVASGDTTEDDAIVFVVPSPFADGGAAIVLVVRVTPTPADEELEASEAAAALALEELERARRRAPTPRSAPLLLWPGVREALAGLKRPGQQRSALVYLAERAEAAAAEDVALAGSDAIVDRIAQTIGDALEESGTQPRGEELAWLIERSAYEALTNDAHREEPVARAALFRHAGVLGRSPDVLARAMRLSVDRDDLARRLTDEHRAYLTDLDLAARVRAYDWLEARGEAPDGFDPLGRREDRLDALRRNVSEREAADE